MVHAVLLEGDLSPGVVDDKLKILAILKRKSRYYTVMNWFAVVSLPVRKYAPPILETIIQARRGNTVARP
ncbi:hypothetical protein [Brucella anthropi]|uniref:hypothetical protein n=1 Tax=Brucella anthropi TaxID=529 RepID=UPI00235FA5CB|nr:hypothetical protein [Brucella anthropi]